jgi:hypothetical protein
MRNLNDNSTAKAARKSSKKGHFSRMLSNLPIVILAAVASLYLIYQIYLLSITRF